MKSPREFCASIVLHVVHVGNKTPTWNKVQDFSRLQSSTRPAGRAISPPNPHHCCVVDIATALPIVDLMAQFRGNGNRCRRQKFLLAFRL